MSEAKRLSGKPVADQMTEENQKLAYQLRQQGIIPLLAGILAGSFVVLLIVIVMTVAAAGDILIIWKVLTYQSKAGTVVYVDHPTQAGGVIFEK